MKFILKHQPTELQISRIWYFEIYSNKTYKNITIELDENDEKIIEFECGCRKNTINDSMNKKQTKCRHIKDCIKIIRSMGYLKFEEEEFVFTNQKIKPKDL